MPLGDKTVLGTFLSLALFFCASGVFLEGVTIDVICGVSAPLYVGIAEWWRRLKRI